MGKKQRILAISDIHGHGHLLSKLLKKAKYRPKKDKLVLLGDYVNKGPDSIGTLKQVKKLCSKGVIALLGNNEIRWLRSKPKAIRHYMDFLHSLHTWYIIEPYIFVHAGFEKGVPLYQQSVEVMTGLHPCEKYGRVEDFITVFGHTPTFRLGSDKIWIGNKKIGIDTGAGHGKKLSLVDLTNKEVFEMDTKETDKVRKYSF